jgi:hypothetical protein
VPVLDELTYQRAPDCTTGPRDKDAHGVLLSVTCHIPRVSGVTRMTPGDGKM